MLKLIKYWFKFASFSIPALMMPAVVLAQDRITGMLSLFSYWIIILVYLVIALALIYFLWGVVRYITAGDSEEGRRDARNMMIYGIIGLFVMVSVWGLVYVVGTLVGIEPGAGGNTSPGLPGEGIIKTGTGWYFDQLLKINFWFAIIIAVLIGLALLLFLWGVAKYIAGGADEEKRIEARGLIIYGILGLFSMVSVWGLVAVIGQTFNIGQGGGAGTVPQIDNIDLGGGNKIEGEAMTKCDVEWDPSAAGGSGTTFKALVCYILKYLNPLPPIMVALSMLYLFWGIAKYMGAHDAEELRTGRNTIIYGIIALFVLTSVWALVYIIQGEFGLG